MRVKSTIEFAIAAPTTAELEARQRWHTNCTHFPLTRVLRLRKEHSMPEAKTKERARQAKRAGKSPKTQAGEFVREEIHHVREGKHGARSPQQAIAIGLSKARRAGVEVPPPEKGEAKESTRKSAERALERGRGAPPKRKATPKRKRATKRALEREPTSTVSKQALSSQAKKAAKRRTPTERSASAKKAARTKGAVGRKRAAKKAARTRAAHA
jgi:hypothetical protein